MIPIAIPPNAQTYITNVNNALEKFPEMASLGLREYGAAGAARSPIHSGHAPSCNSVDLNKAVGTDKIPKELATVVRNNGGGHWNHSFFWKCMAAPSSTNGPSADLKVGGGESDHV